MLKARREHGVATGWSQRILLVDDEIFIRRFNAEMLKGAGYRVDSAEDGEVGWAALHTHRYDLLITDNKMPKVSGVELITKLRDENMTLPIILTTGGGVSAQELCLSPQLPLVITLVKPYTFEKLLRTVEQVLRQSDSVVGSCSAAHGSEDLRP